MNNDSSRNESTSRRDFVKQTSLVAGGLMAAPLFSKGNFFSGADDTIKIALVGCGGRGTGAALQALSTKQNVKLVAMADAFRDNLDRCYNSLTGESRRATQTSVKEKVAVPEENKFTGFDGYQKA